MFRERKALIVIFGAGLILLGATAGSAAPGSSVSASAVSFQGAGEAKAWTLSVSGPGDLSFKLQSTGGPPSLGLSVDGFTLPDGRYTYELVKSAGKASSEAANGLRGLSGSGKRNAISGTVTILNGQFVIPTVEAAYESAEPTVGTGGSSLLGDLSQEDQIICDDLIVNCGSLCVGFDCVNGESFGFDTIRMKENNTRLHFLDTSSTASFPRRDWRIIANDSSNGGLERFSIEDIDGGRIPFTLEGGAPANSMWIDDGGRLGLGTATPVVEVHIVDGDTPTLRLEQDGSSGFTPQTWDVAGNETNFFVRDVTHGSTLPFKILPDAPSNALVIAGDGDIGVGTTSPDLGIHIARTNLAGFRVEDTNDSVEWDLRMDGTQDFLVTEGGSGGTEFSIANGVLSGNTRKFFFGQGGTVLMEIQADGDVNSSTGVFGTISDRDSKTDINAVSPRQVLARVSNLPISTWRYKQNSDELHIGPMAQDFYAAFGFHEGSKSIALNDLSGVALAAIQGLNEVIVDKDALIQDLMDRVAALEAKLDDDFK